MSVSRVVDVEAIPLVAGSGPTDLDASNETVLVRVTDEDGLVGVGEADAPARVVRELVHMDDLFEWSRGLRSIVVGLDPFELAANHARMLHDTQYHGRRGLGIHAISAVDIALYDLAGKQLGRPAYQLLGGACPGQAAPLRDDLARKPEWPHDRRGHGQHRLALREGARPRLPRGQDGGRLRRPGRRPRARALHPQGPRAARPRHHDAGRLRVSLDALARRRARADALEDCDIFLAEATVQHDDLDGHARLAQVAPMRIAGAEFAATVQECREWLERGKVDVLQPDVNRCGGLTELRRIAELAFHHGAEVVPHGWKTGITAAAQRHFQAATPCCPHDRDLPSGPVRVEATSKPDGVRGGHTGRVHGAPGTSWARH